jgi:LysM repeat protein
MAWVCTLFYDSRRCRLRLHGAAAKRRVRCVLLVGGCAVSSLRPLLTILLLAAVGVVLYMKINETEPVIPAGVGDWTAGPLELGGGTPAADAGAATSAPNYAADALPPFVPGTTSVPAPNTASTAPKNEPAAGDEAPSWSPSPTAASEPANTAHDASAASAESSPVARTAEPEAKLPAMPSMPESTASADAAATSPNPAPAYTPNLNPPTADAAPTFTPSIDVPLPAAATAAAAAAGIAAEAKENAAVASDPITPTASTPVESPAPAKTSLYPSVRVAVQSELERGELGQALLRLSDWYGDPSLSPEESKEVETLLSQLAGSVIWEGPPAHRLEPAHVVQAGESLQTIAAKYDVPWELLAKINGVTDPAALQPGQELKVLRGKFSALVDLSERTMTLMLDRRYAGKFAIELDPTTAIEEGQWKVDQKALTPAGGVYGQPNGATEDRSLLLSNPASPNSQAAVLRGPGNSDPASPQPAGRVIRLKSSDVNDVFDILSVGSRVTIRR